MSNGLPFHTLQGFPVFADVPAESGRIVPLSASITVIDYGLCRRLHDSRSRDSHRSCRLEFEVIQQVSSFKSASSEGPPIMTPPMTGQGVATTAPSLPLIRRRVTRRRVTRQRGKRFTEGGFRRTRCLDTQVFCSTARSPGAGRRQARACCDLAPSALGERFPIVDKERPDDKQT